MSLFATKPIESGRVGEAVDPAQPLRRVLGAVDLTMLGIGAIIVTGIFVLTGQAAAVHAGPAVVLSMIIAGLASALAAILLCGVRLGELVSIGTLFAFVIVSIGVIVLRRTRPDLERPFKVRFVPALPIGSALVSFLLMLALPWSTWERLIVWMILGLVIYFAYGRKHSKLSKHRH